MLWHMLAGVPNVKCKRVTKWLSELANSSEGKESIYELSKGKTISGLRSSIFKTQYLVGRFRCLKLTTTTWSCQLWTLSKQTLEGDFYRHEYWDGRFSGICFVFCLASGLVQLVCEFLECCWGQKGQNVTVIEKESLPGENRTSDREKERFVNKTELRPPEWIKSPSRCFIPSEDYEIALDKKHFDEDSLMWSILKRTNI